MNMENEKLYPYCPTIIRDITIGGLTKSQLMQKLQEHSIMMNEYAEKLFHNDNFTTSDFTFSVKTVELTARDLGFPDGATMTQIIERARKVGLNLCPLELGPHMRLQYLDQPEGYLGKPAFQHQAPYGSITIVSERLTQDEDLLEGFYLRRIDGVLWVRGYHASQDHAWNPDDHLMFLSNN
ncbi:hypothetical protein [Clostridium sp.]|uniref:hypothetical protein n=1 Tax=Clostridium sp. TaxID=1506 RepID=UPI002FC9796F